MMPKTPHLFLRFYINGVAVYATDCDNVKSASLRAATGSRLPARHASPRWVARTA